MRNFSINLAEMVMKLFLRSEIQDGRLYFRMRLVDAFSTSQDKL